MTRFLRNFIPSMTAIFLLVGAFALIEMNHIEPAQACRDCPFPLKVGPGRWKLPGGLSELQIDEINLGGGRIQSIVRLVDAVTGDLLAIGKLDHLKGRKRIKVELYDLSGAPLEADLHYADVTRNQLRVNFTCKQCMLKAAYLN